LVVKALDPQPGDTIIEIGCGTGMNFPLLQEKLGPKGRIIGIDISGAMLERAEKRISAAGWRNVELILSSAADYTFPDAVDGIIATGVLTYEPDYDTVIKRGSRALVSGKRWVVFDYKMPTGWARHIVPWFVWVFRSLGISRELFNRTPWESIKQHLRNAKIDEYYFGLIFIASGEAS
jgi:demethylmenaquinone methyltransferase/2-methoxy-6-polyprenyl-1,4-benzoquinol methylase